MYIYIYIYRERERERENGLSRLVGAIGVRRLTMLGRAPEASQGLLLSRMWPRTTDVPYPGKGNSYTEHSKNDSIIKHISSTPLAQDSPTSPRPPQFAPKWRPRPPPRLQSYVRTPSPPIKSLDFGGFDSSRLLILRVGNSHVRLIL